MYAKFFLKDALRIGAAPVWWKEADWLTFGAVTAGTGLLVWQDEEIRDAFQRSRTRTTNRVANRLTPFGAPAIAQPVLIGTFTLSTVFGEKKLQALALDGWEASYFALTATSLLKAATGRARPFEERGVWTRTGFSTGSSFPSGHTTQAFVLAAVASGHFPKTWVKVASFGLATGVGLARMNDDKHFASDILIGAALGHSVGRTIFKRNEKRRQKNVSQR
jgi:membrane-associated phospholipid phosphatase